MASQPLLSDGERIAVPDLDRKYQYSMKRLRSSSAFKRGGKKENNSPGKKKKLAE